jgi:hypothetical protein
MSYSTSNVAVTGTASIIVASDTIDRTILLGPSDNYIGFDSGVEISATTVPFVLPAGVALYCATSGGAGYQQVMVTKAPGPSSFSGTFSGTIS